MDSALLSQREADLDCEGDQVPSGLIRDIRLLSEQLVPAD
jgi:hypothetical protein